jgi:sphinganine-1-phosphate aldolase
MTKSRNRTSIPEEGIAHAQLLEQLSSFKVDDADYRGGRTWSLVYHVDDAHGDFLKAAHAMYASENGLNPMAFQSLKRMEADIVRMTLDMLHSEEEGVGTLTSGGTESILLAVKAARDRAKKTRPWILSPEIVVPKTIHVAFDKAAHYFGLKIRHAPVRADLRVNVEAMKKLIGRNTVLVAASAPQYPHGVIDPIPEVAALAADKGIPMHVDACVGGFMLPWLERAGVAVAPWDFRVPGVTSISADIHKYGYAAKGASTLTYCSMDYMKHQFFVQTDWPGGIYASPSIPGTRPGGSIAAAWAAMMTMGKGGYTELARRARDVTLQLAEGLAAIEGLRVLAPPDMTIVAYASDAEDVDIYAVADQLEAKGWSVDRQQHPNCIHLTVNANNAPQVGPYLADVEAAVKVVQANPDLAASGNAAMYGMMARVPVRGFVKAAVGKVMEGMYGPDGDVPDMSKLGEDEKADLLLQLIHKYGDQAMDIIGKIEGGRDKVLSTIGGVTDKITRKRDKQD